MRDAIEIVFSSTLATSREVVWHWVSATDGVSSELFPLVRMTHPRDQRSLGEAAVVPGQVVFGRLVPALRRPALRPPRTGPWGGGGRVRLRGGVHVLAATSMAHERTLTDRVDGGCVITNRLIIEPRVGLARPLVAVIAVRLFHHRHLRLRRRFGTP